MSLPGVTLNVIDGNLSIQPASTQNVVLYMGVCTKGTPNTLYTFSDSQAMVSALGLGKLVEMGSYALGVSGGPAQFMPLEPSARGGAGTVTQLGVGPTVTVTLAPHVSVLITCVTGGTLGTATFTFSLNGGTASAPVTSAAGWSSTGYRVPGTYCTVVFTSGTYVGTGGPADTYLISVLGAVTHPTGAGPTVPTFIASPVDDYRVLLTCTAAGALGTGQFTYSLDSTDASTSSTIVTAGSGAYAIPNTGVVVTFGGSLASALATTWSFKTASPTYGSSNVSDAFSALGTTYLASGFYSMVDLIDGNATSSAWATQAASLQTQMTTLFTAGIYGRVFNQCPQVGSISPDGSGGITVDSADTDAVVAGNAASVEAARVAACAGDCDLVSPFTGLLFRRSIAWPSVARAASVEASQNIGFVGLGGLPGVAALYRDEAATPLLDAARFITLRTFPGAVLQGTGLPGFFCTDGHTMALTTSDYSRLTNARVVDQACVIAKAATLPLVQSKIPTTTRAGLPGVITEKKAQQIEAIVNAKERQGLVDVEPQNAVAVAVAVNRTNNVLATSNLILSVAVQPFGYARTITVNIGMTISAA